MNSTAKPCIALDCRMLGMSGIGVYLQNLIPLVLQGLPQCRFRLIGNPTKIGALPLTGLENGATDAAVDIHPCLAPIYSIQEQALLPLAARGADLLWVPHYNIPLLTTVPLLVTVHDVAHLVLPEVTRSLARHSYARLLFAGVRCKARTILCVSQFTADEFVRLVGRPRGEMRVVHNGVDAAWFTEGEKPADTREEQASAPYFIAVGNLKAHKRVDLLCRAFAAVQDKLPHNLLLVGKHDGFISGGQSVADLMALAPGRIHCTGAIDTPHLRTLVRHAAALVFPSSYEGFGLPPLEAMAAGVPVIAADIPPVREVCGPWVRYFTVDNEAMLAQRLLELAAGALHDIPAAQHHAAQFSWSSAAHATVDALQRMLSPGHPLRKKQA